MSADRTRPPPTAGPQERRQAPAGCYVAMAVPSPKPSGSVGRPDRLRPDLAPPAALLAMALDLAGELLLAEVDRVAKVARAVLRAQGHTLQSQSGLRHLVVGDGRVALLVDLDLETRELRHLLAHLREAPLDVLAELVGHGGVATLDLDLHTDPLGRMTGPRPRYPRVHFISTPARRRPHTRCRPPLVAAPKRTPRASRPWCAHRRPARRWTVDRRARGCRCDPAPGAPRATSRPGASALPRGPGSAPPARPRAGRRSRRPGSRRGRSRARAGAADGWAPARARRARASRPGGAPATICAAIASATPSAPRNFSACTSARAGPSKATGAHARATRRARRRAAPRRRAPAARSAGSARRAGSAARARQAQHSGWPAATAAPQAQHAGGARAAPRCGEQMADGGEHPRDAGARARHASTARLRQSCAVAADASWTFDPGALALVGLADGGLRPALAPRARQATARAPRPSAAWWPSPRGLLALIAALISPIDRLGEQAFVMHMVQHILLLDVVPILLIVSLTKVILRPATRRLQRLERSAGPLAHPAAAVVLYVGRDVGLAHPRALRRRAAPPARARPRAHVLHDRRASCTGGTCCRPSARARA